jgi:hypothetical protein
MVPPPQRNNAGGRIWPLTFNKCLGQGRVAPYIWYPWIPSWPTQGQVYHLPWPFRFKFVFFLISTSLGTNCSSALIPSVWFFHHFHCHVPLQIGNVIYFKFLTNVFSFRLTLCPIFKYIARLSCVFPLLLLPLLFKDSFSLQHFITVYQYFS